MERAVTEGPANADETARRLRTLEEQRDAAILALLALARALAPAERAGLRTDLRDAASAMTRRGEPDGAAMLRRLVGAMGDDEEPLDPETAPEQAH